VPVERLLAAQAQVAAEVAPTVGLMPFHPAADGTVVTAPPAAALAEGSASGVPLVVGTTAEEMRLYLDAGVPTLDEARLRGRLARYLRLRGAADPDDGAARLASCYLDLGEEPGDAWARAWSDGEMRLPALRVATTQRRHEARTFVYEFDWRSPIVREGGRLGACHAIDLPFTFATFDRCGWGEFVGADADADALSAELRAAWCRFAATGEPGWPAYTERDGRPVRRLARTSETVADPDEAVRTAWGEVLDVPND
jgi:para-nitrobenzyl esterase